MKSSSDLSIAKTKDESQQIEEVTAGISIHQKSLLKIIEGFHGSDIDPRSLPIQNGKKLTLFGKDYDQHEAEAFRIGLELYEQDKKIREEKEKSRMQFILNKTMIAIFTESETDAASDVAHTLKNYFGR